jgi:multidrug resistance protein MdtO
MPVRMAHHLSKLIPLLAPLPGRVAFASRIALICALTVLVAEIYQTPDPALTTYIVFFLNREDRASTIVTNIVLLMMMTVVIGLIIAVSMIVADDPMWRVVSMTVISLCFLYLTSASKLRPIGSIVALIVGYGLDELGLVQMGELATRGFLYAWLFVGIPVAVSTVVNLLLAPPPRRLAERAIARRLSLAAAMLRTPDERTTRRFRECLNEGFKAGSTWQNARKVRPQRTLLHFDRLPVPPSLSCRPSTCRTAMLTPDFPVCCANTSQIPWRKCPGY